MRKVLVLRGGALGDFIVTLPALAALRARWPDARIELVGNTAAAALAVKRGLLDVAHSQHEARWWALFDAAPLPPALASWLAEFDLVVNFWPDDDGVLRGHFPPRADQIFLHAAAMPARGPAALHYCEPLRALDITPAAPWLALATPAPDARSIAIHPGSGSPKKNWPVKRWIELIGTLPRPVLVILGEAENASAFRSSPEIVLAVNQPLETLVAELRTARLFLGHDSGISHLAAACGVPSLVLFGPTDPGMWAPPAPHVRVLRRGTDLSSLSVGDVHEAIASLLALKR
jgi:heptosyltransferase-3